MNDSREKWLAIDTTIKKLKRLNYWFTSIDPEKKHINAALNELEQAKRLLEER